MVIRNIFSEIPNSINGEMFEILTRNEHFMLERIISSGQATPPGEWFDQDTNEWVILLSGGAGLVFEDEAGECVMHPGDYVHILTHRRHRVGWTDSKEKTVWLAIHYGS
jgi:cupin 2 domain-containing protein